MLTGESLDQFIDAYWERDRAAGPEDGWGGGGGRRSRIGRFLHPDTEGEEELEEYRLKEDGVIVEPIRRGKVGTRTWIALLVILTGVSFGGEAGFLVGCFIILVSNMFAGHGPWTPWQMFSYGMIGFLAGILYQKGIMKASRVQLCIYGFLSVFFIFGGIMNPASILMTYGRITKSSLLAHYISGAPVDMVQATATVIFLWFMSRPMLEKLERIKKKYGLIQR